MQVKDLFQAIGERLQGAATVKAVFGDPIVAGDRTIIPVARLRFGFGAGGGSARGSPDERGGGGGGGGVIAKPAGVVEISPAGTTFRTFPDYPQLLTVFALGLVIGMVLKRRKR